MKSQSMMLLTKIHRFITRIAITFALLINSAMATDPPALNDISSYLVCASENQSFVLPRVCDVAYGANGKFVFKAAQSGTVVFNNATFGDPIPGVVKSGYYRFAGGFAVSTVTTSGTGLTADYYDNVFVKGFPLRRIDAMVNFPWYGAVPMSDVPKENFSVRWTGQIQARFDGDVTLIITSDDGVKAWVDGQLIINDWTAHDNKENLGRFASLAGQKHDLRIEYYQGGGGSFMRLEWQSTNEPRTVVPATCLYPVGADTPLVLPTYVTGTGTGLTGDYRHTADSIGSRLRRLDPIINFPWGGGSPDPSISADNFTVRWSGQIQTRFDGDCTLSTISDDGVRLFIDGKLLINDWNLHGNKENFCTFPSLAGQKHDIRIEYFEAGGGAAMYLKWQSANEGYTLVPTSCLYPYNVATMIPTASAVSPAFFEGVYGVTLPTINTGVLSDLGESQFYANVPLSATETTPITLTEGSAISSGSIVWTPTVVTEGPALVIRKGDSLLLAFPTAGSVMITSYSGTFLPPVAVASGQLLPVVFSKAGEFKVLARDGNGNEVGSRMVTVVSVELPKSILGEVQFTRALNLSVSPANAPITFMGNNQLTVTTTAIADGLAKLALKPLARGTPRLLARINGLNGPLVCEKEIAEFTIDTAALKSSIINAQTDIGTASLVMRPYIQQEVFSLSMFAHTSTFRGGATSMTIGTTAGPSSNGENPFEQKYDAATNETIGIFRFDIEMPQNEDKYCFRVERSQENSQQGGSTKAPVPNGASSNINGSGCKIFVDPVCLCIDAGGSAGGASDIRHLTIRNSEMTETTKGPWSVDITGNGSTPLFIATGTAHATPDYMCEQVKSYDVKAGSSPGNYDVVVGGTVFAARITAVKIEIEQVRFVLLNGTKSFLVTVTPSPLPDHCSVKLELSRTSGTMGKVTFDGGSSSRTIHGTESPIVHGDEASDPDERNMRMTANVDGHESGSHDCATDDFKVTSHGFTHKTTWTAPDGTPDDRTKVGVCELVVLTATASTSWTWTASSGTLDSPNDQTCTWTAPTEPDPSTLIAITFGDGTRRSVFFKSIKPTAIDYRFIRHEPPVPAPGTFGELAKITAYLQPKDVNFFGIKVREVGTGPSNPPVYAGPYFSGLTPANREHIATSDFDPVELDNGISGPDLIGVVNDAAGSFNFNGPYSDSSSESFAIPHEYQNKSGSAMIDMEVTGTQSYTVSPTGLLTVTKVAGGTPVTVTRDTITGVATP